MRCSTRGECLESPRAVATGTDFVHSKTRSAGLPVVGWWIFGDWGRVSRSGAVLSDRYYGDLCVDPARYRYGGPMWLAKLWTRLLPSPDHLLLLDAEPEILLSSKQEVNHKALERSLTSYHRLVERAGGRVINVARPVETIAEEILGIISNDDHDTEFR